MDVKDFFYDIDENLIARKLWRKDFLFRFFLGLTTLLLSIGAGVAFFFLAKSIDLTYHFWVAVAFIIILFLKGLYLCVDALIWHYSGKKYFNGDDD